MSELGMTARYDIRSELKGWTVYDTLTGLPAVINDVPQTSLALEDADDLADLLNHLQCREARTHGQPHERCSVSAAPRAPRRQRFRFQDTGQGGDSDLR